MQSEMSKCPISPYSVKTSDFLIKKVVWLLSCISALSFIFLFSQSSVPPISIAGRQAGPK